MLSLVRTLGGGGHSSDGDHTDPRDLASSNGSDGPADGIRVDPCRKAINDLLGHLVATTNAPHNRAQGKYLTELEFFFLRDELSQYAKFVSAFCWGTFDAVELTALIYRLAWMNDEECLAFTNERQASAENPRLTAQLKEFGEGHKEIYETPARAFLAALFAALLTS